MLKEKIKLGAVSYLNALPLLYGIQNGDLSDLVSLEVDYPSRLADKLRNGKLDIGLIPVAAMPGIPGARIIGDYGIAADGAVASVCLFSHVPIEDIREVYMDYQSRTSVRLAQFLLEAYWKIPAAFLPAPEDYISRIAGTKAGVIIGDRALVHAGDFPYVYDLATAWKAFTGLPFVFAAWIGTSEMTESFTASFNAANSMGLGHIDHIVESTSFPYYDLKKYYTQNIHYLLDGEKKKGLAAFLEVLRKSNPA